MKIILTTSQTLAFSAYTGSFGIDIGIFWAKQVAVRAMRLFFSLLYSLLTTCSQYSRTFASFKVFLLRYNFQVRGIYTVSSPAQMVDLFIRRYFLVGRFVNKLVRRYGQIVVIKSSIAARVTRPKPYPTRSKIGTILWNRTIFVDFRPKTFFSGFAWFCVVNMQTCLAMCLPSLVMQCTHTTFTTWPFAAFNTTRFRSWSDAFVMQSAQIFSKARTLAPFNTTQVHSMILLQVVGNCK